MAKFNDTVVNAAKKVLNMPNDLREYEKKIDLLNIVSESDVPSDVKELRHRVLSVHNNLDSELVTAIVYKIFAEEYGENGKVTEKVFGDNQDELERMFRKVGKMPFSQKLDKARQLKIYSEELLGRMDKFNDDRNDLAHGGANEYQIQKFESQEERLRVLKDAWEIVKDICKYEGKFEVPLVEEIITKMKKPPF